MLYSAISAVLFYVFAFAALLCAVGVVAFRNPVSSALSMALCFGFTSAIFFNLGATFLGISQIIVYAGAILVLFLFIIMMLDVKSEEERGVSSFVSTVVGVVVAGVFAGLMVKAVEALPGSKGGRCPVHVLVESSGELCVGEEAEAAAQMPKLQPYGGALPALQLPEKSSDTALLGNTLFSRYSIPFVLLSFALLAGSAGAVAVGRKLRKD
ncbi:MAG: NADH-quinone oxidoreductase subunit J [Akkermansiaceae bacterium]|nr:NADH-quinone oxidoreductase subunit J [Akkermansiaceae bacterium]